MNLPATVDGLDQVTLPDNRPLHLAIGMFDGVHRGHQLVIRTATEAAAQSGGISGVLTFWPHPSALFRPDQAVPQIMSPELKKRVLRSLGIDLIIQQPFTPEFASIPAEEVLKHLKTRLPSLASVYVGENWRFGKGRAGDIHLLVKLGQSLGIKVNSAPRLKHEGEPISSTRIRSCLTKGEIAAANALFGYRYFSEGRIEEGKKLGRTLGFPTLNLPWTPPLKPRFGVYVVRVSSLDDDNVSTTPLSGVANYGVRPTVETAATPSPLLEIFLLEKTCPWTAGSRIHVEWIEFLRPEKRFSDTGELKLQIARDIEEARKIAPAS